MPTFPPLTPSSRTHTPAAKPATAGLSLSGRRSVVGHSNASLGGQLRLSFIGLSEAERLQLEAHYHGQKGNFIPFALPGDGGGFQIVPGITYSQSSVYTDNDPATFAGMTNGVFAEATQTGTNSEAQPWVMMDLGAVTAVKKVVVGTDFTEVLAGGWSAAYTENRDVEGSTDGTTWTVLFNTGTFTQGIQQYTVDASVRYIRIVGEDDFLCVTEFYAMTATAGSGQLWRYVDPPEIEDFCGPPPYYNASITLEPV